MSVEPGEGVEGVVTWARVPGVEEEGVTWAGVPGAEQEVASLRCVQVTS